MSKRLQESQVDVPSDANALIIILVLAPSPGYGCTSAKKNEKQSSLLSSSFNV